MNKVCRGWNYTSNHLSDEDGRIVVIWKDSVSVNILCQSRQTLTCEVKIPSSSLFVYTAIYASNESTERADLWVELLNLHHTYALSTVPWMLGGDLNQIIHYDEHSIASVNSFTARMVELKDCLLQMELFDMRFQGPLFTWSNRQPDDPIAKKLDCLLINNHVLNLFPNCTSFFLPTFFSDHSPCITDLSFTIPSSGTRPFKFFNYLTLHPEFHCVVSETWSCAGSIVSNLTSLFWKQKQIKSVLNSLNKDNFSDIQKRVGEANCLLQLVQGQVLTTPTSELFEQDKLAL